MVQNIIEFFFGSKNESDLKQLIPILHKINEKENWAMGLRAEQFPAMTAELRQRISNGEKLDEILPEAFALVREAARRVLGERLYDVQLMGGIVLHQGKIVEMKTGEGKTVSSVTAAYLNSLSGNGVHVITVNDYLAERDAGWMGAIYNYLGVSVGVILTQMDNDARKIAYAKDITYGTNNEFGFDYLRDNMRLDSESKVQRSFTYAIIDEIDSILIDEARTPLIISGSADDDTRIYMDVNRIVNDLVECAKDPKTGDYPEELEGDYKLDEKGKRVVFTDEGLNHVEALLQNRGVIRGSLFDDQNFEYIHHVTQAVRSHKLFHLDTDYVVQDAQVQIVDEFTGRILYGRRYSDGLHQAIEAKEGIKVAMRNRTLATITFQNYFRMYGKISGMTGTAETEAKEFGKIYNLDVVVIPTNRPVIRNDDDDLIYLNEPDKFEAICDEIAEVNKQGQPILVGTVSIDKSEKLSNLLTRRGVRHEVLNAKNHAREALIIAEAGAKGAVTIATNMAGRGTDIKLGGNPEYRARRRAGTEATQEEYELAYKKEIEVWRDQYAEIQRVGGLYVLGTERHESRRIDNQLRGRSGRQGDPGLSRFFISMDDELMRLFGGGSGGLKNLMARVGMQPGEPINSPLITRSIERAQRRVEDRNFEIRKHLLDYDDVLNEQRKFIYQQRDAILEDTDLTERVLQTGRDIIDDALQPYLKSRGDDKQLFTEFMNVLRDKLYFSSEQPIEELTQSSPEQLRETIIAEMSKELSEKSEIVGTEMLNMAIRYEYLRNIDARWQDHLENLEALREAVYLRAYGQKNPLLEYKLEGFQIFDELLYDIRIAIARKLYAVKAEGMRTPAPGVRAGGARHVAVHSEVSMFAGGGAATATQTAAMPAQAQIKRSYPKVGRNDPCPCGSGKKYKYCHGR
ncbi:MAG TPA: preprotein translocase subunit SecA [Spirochaetia bacterium]|nr:preprotein translocase subunit SecA [Spirochaetia bacterium]